MSKFNEKYPIKKSKYKKIEVPDLLKSLFNTYEINFRSEFDKHYKKEDEVRTLENLANSLKNTYHSEEINIKNIINDNCTGTLQLNNFLHTTRQLIHLYHELNKQQWNLETISYEEGHASGKLYALHETWKEIKQIATINPGQFIQECFHVNEDDAEFIADIIQLRRGRQKPPTS